jgi:peptidyl-tRNA hydrolase, PTH1 family
MILIAGLGNPGRLYLHNRHNVGFHVVDLLAKRSRISFEHRKANALMGRGRFAGQEVVLAKPQTFMNRSGVAVAALLRWLHARPSDLIVVYDDLDLPIGGLRLRASGSAGGHHGMESIIAELGSREFARLRIGIGRPGASRSPDDVADYVLGDFSGTERQAMAAVYARAAEAIELVLTDGLVAAMNRCNSQLPANDSGKLA